MRGGIDNEERNVNGTGDFDTFRTEENKKSHDTVRAYLKSIAGTYLKVQKNDSIALLEIIEKHGLEKKEKKKKMANRYSSGKLAHPSYEIDTNQITSDKDRREYLFLRKKMIEANLPLVVKIARRYLNRGLLLLDLIQEGNLGLFRAVEKFNPTTEFLFSTYATGWIRDTIERGIMNQSRTIRLPIHIVKEMNAYLKVWRILQEEMDTNPTPDDIAKRTNKPVERVEKILKLSKQTIPVDASYGDNSDGDEPFINCIADERPSPENILIQSEEESEVELDVESKLKDGVMQLTEIQQKVVRRLYGLYDFEVQTQKEIAKEFKKTEEEICQIQVEAEKDLKKIMENNGLSAKVLFSK